MERMARGDVGAPLPLTGRYAVQGAQVRAGLELWARQTGARLVLLDDCSDPRQAALMAAADELERIGVPTERQTILVTAGLGRQPGRKTVEISLPS